LKRGSLLVVLAVLVSAQPILFSYGQCLGDCSAGRIDDVVQPLIDSGERVGVVVGVINKEGIRTFSYGETVMDSGNKPDGDTIFEIGSVTKTFTTLLLADMVERNMLELEDPVENFLPSSVNVPSFNGTKITLLDLATHTSGLPSIPTNFNPEDESNPYADYTAELLYEFLSDYSLEREPGTEYQYSNVGMALLGHVLELETGIDYETLVTDRICNSLGLDDTRISLSAEQEQRLAPGYFSEFDPWIQDYKHELVPHWDFDVFAPAGALRSTVLDLLVYVSANLGLTETDLSSAIELTHTVRRETTLQSMKICLGWHTLDYEEAEIIMHHGATYGFHSNVLFIKEEAVGVVLLSNTYAYESNSIDDAGLEILQILREYQTLVADFSCSPLTSRVNESVTFNATACYSKIGNITAYEWDFGDGSIKTTNQPVINYSFTNPGIHSVTLTVVDNNDLSCTTSSNVTVTFKTDLNKDKTVNIIDISTVAIAFGTNEGDDRYDPIADLDDNKQINIVDISIVAITYGKTV
jgi:D-alanyl-D-alanine-carboxypeptidase/D-alanyl-D-alanine-endopeptidase